MKSTGFVGAKAESGGYSRREIVRKVCLLASLTALSRPASAAAGPWSKLFRDYALDVRWRPIDRRLPTVTVSPDGLAGVNKDKQIYPEAQAVGEQFIRRGLFNDNAQWVADGWKILDRGFQGISPEGRLEGSTTDLAHSSSFLVAAMGQALLLDGAGATEERRAKFLSAARYMSQEPFLSEGQAMGQRFGHRNFIWSLIFKIATLFGGDFHEQASLFMTKTLDHEMSNGAFSENYGFDILYASIGAQYLACCTILEDDAELKKRQTWALLRYVSQICAHVQVSGRIESSDSTRVFKELDRAGKMKIASRWQIAIALIAGGIIGNDDHFFAVADRALSCDDVCQRG